MQGTRGTPEQPGYIGAHEVHPMYPGYIGVHEVHPMYPEYIGVHEVHPMYPGYMRGTSIRWSRGRSTALDRDPVRVYPYYSCGTWDTHIRRACMSAYACLPYGRSVGP